MTNETIATETTETVGEFPIDELLSDGITNTPPSFVRAILAAASDPAVTSFAGGLPNPISFPQEKLLESMQRVVAERGPEAFSTPSPPACPSCAPGSPSATTTASAPTTPKRTCS